ncbi:MAG TPA: DMT family transporter [Micromonosporaceae bacterium]|nr:DMT family transporter [Micromonosporaceae bacterium]
MTQLAEAAATTRRSRVLPLLAIAITVVLWASAFVAIRYVGRDVSAGPMALGRLLVASILLGLWVFLTDRSSRRRGGDGSSAISAGSTDPQPLRRWPDRRGWLLLASCGAVWFGGYNIALNEAERRIDAGTAAMLVGIGPILIALLAGLLLREGLPPAVLLGCAIAFAGVVIIAIPSGPGSSSDALGVVLGVASAVAYAVGVVVQKPLLTTTSAPRVTWLACTIGLVVCLPFAPALLRELGTASTASIAWIVYLGAMPTALAFTTWAYALARSTAGRLGATTYLVPPLAVLMGWVLLAERPAALAFVGGAVCLLGVYVARRTRSRA